MVPVVNVARLEDQPGREDEQVLVSHTGVPLTRPVAFRFALDPTAEQVRALYLHAGAARFAYNHHVIRVRENLRTRAAEAERGVSTDEMTPSLSWSRVSLINEFNAWKNGKADTSPSWVEDLPDGSYVERRGLPWKDELASQDVFECASVNAAQALANFSGSRMGTRKGTKVRLPKVKKRNKTTPAFKLRSKSKPGATAPIRICGPKSIRLSGLGEYRIHGCTKKVRRMLAAGRLHLHGATVRYERGRWWVALQGVAAVFHEQRRCPADRHQAPAGMDRGVKTRAVVADSNGVVLRAEQGVKALQHTQVRLRVANKALARTKPGSRGHAKARSRLTKVHARVWNLRQHHSHLLTTWAATELTRLVVEDLNVFGMFQLRSLARAVSDQSLGNLGRQLEYKASWYGLDLVKADRWFASSKTCSTCGHVRAQLGLDERVYRCDQPACGLVLDRDVNAAVNLARWRPSTTAASATDSTATAPPHAA